MWVSGWTDGWVGSWCSGRIGGGKDGRREVCMERMVNIRMGEWKTESIGKWTDR